MAVRADWEKMADSIVAGGEKGKRQTVGKVGVFVQISPH